MIEILFSMAIIGLGLCAFVLIVPSAIQGVSMLNHSFDLHTFFLPRAVAQDRRQADRRKITQTFDIEGPSYIRRHDLSDEVVPVANCERVNQRRNGEDRRHG